MNASTRLPHPTTDDSAKPVDGREIRSSTEDAKSTEPWGIIKDIIKADARRDSKQFVEHFNTRQQGE